MSEETERQKRAHALAQDAEQAKRLRSQKHSETAKAPAPDVPKSLTMRQKKLNQIQSFEQQMAQADYDLGKAREQAHQLELMIAQCQGGLAVARADLADMPPDEPPKE